MRNLYSLIRGFLENYLVNYFSLMHYFGVNTNLLPHLLPNIFSCNILIISCKMLIIITVISSETTNELTIYAKLSQNVTLFLGSFFMSSAGKLKECGNFFKYFYSKYFSSRCFIEGDSYIKSYP